MTSDLVEEHIYEANQYAGWGLSVWKEMFAEQVRSRELTWRLFMRDFSARYRQSVLGVLWALILPLMAVATFVLLNSSGLLNVGETGVALSGLCAVRVDHLAGVCGWVDGLYKLSHSGRRTYCQDQLSQGALILAAIGQVIFELLVRVVLLAVVMAIFQITPRWTFIFFPFTLLPLLMFTLGLGFLLALVNVVLRDVGQAVTVATTFLMFLTPVVYPAPNKGTLASIMAVNPLTGLVTAPRDVVFTGRLTDPVSFVWAAVLAMVFFFFAWRVFHLVEPRMAERV